MGKGKQTAPQKGLNEKDRTLIRDAFSHYGAEVKKLAKKSEAMGLTDEAEGFKDVLREIGVLYGKVAGEDLVEDEVQDGGDDDE